MEFHLMLDKFKCETLSWVREAIFLHDFFIDKAMALQGREARLL